MRPRELVVGPDEAVLEIVEGQAPTECREALYAFAAAHKPAPHVAGVCRPRGSLLGELPGG